jgi:hypothetical protein
MQNGLDIAMHREIATERVRSIPQAAPIAQVVIREARPEDARAVARLAQLDSAGTPSGPVLVAEAENTIVAALPLNGGPAIADPFQPTLGLVNLLQVRATQLR